MTESDGIVAIRVCGVSDVPEGEVIRAELDDGRAIAVYNRNGEFFATDDLCTHGEASLAEGEIEDGQIFCPFHMGSFDIRTGQACAAPCHVPIKTHQLKIMYNDVILVD